MAHQLSYDKSDDQIPPQALEVKNMKQKEEGEGESERLKESSSYGASKNKIEDSGRERLKRLRVEVAGRVWIPEIWGQEELLKDWIDSTAAFDAPLLPTKILTARTALVQAAASGSTATTVLVD